MKNVMAHTRELAKESFLVGLSFFAEDGKTYARGDAVQYVELEFANGEKVKLTKQEFHCVKDLTFCLERR